MDPGGHLASASILDQGAIDEAAVEQMTTTVVPQPNGPAELYLELLKKSLTYSLWPEPPVPSEFHDPKRPAWKRVVYRLARRLGTRWDLELVHSRSVDPLERDEGKIVPPTYAHTLIGMRRLGNLQTCIEIVLRDDVPGDLIETGVWRGGACIFMRGVLAAHGVAGRRVFLADSFEGLPPPDAEKWPADRGDTYYLNSFFVASQEQVEDNFRRYGLLDSQVVFLKGWFRDTLPKAPVERLAVLRLDGDMYGSTMEALVSLYPKLSDRGFCIVDDYALPGCRQAVDDYRATQGIREPLIEIDWTGRYWRKTAAG
jgi:O-methyltransferase